MWRHIQRDCLNPHTKNHTFPTLFKASLVKVLSRVNCPLTQTKKTGNLIMIAPSFSWSSDNEDIYTWYTQNGQTVLYSVNPMKLLWMYKHILQIQVLRESSKYCHDKFYLTCPISAWNGGEISKKGRKHLCKHFYEF